MGQYNLWSTVESAPAQAEERAARQVRQAASAEARKERDKARRAAEARRKPTTVVMSEHQRRMVEGVLAQLRSTPTAVPYGLVDDAASDPGAPATYIVIPFTFLGTTRRM